MVDTPPLPDLTGGTVLEPAENTVVKLQPVPITDQDRDNAAARNTAADIESSLHALNKREEGVRKSQGQREINLIWEDTQMKIALAVVFGVMVANMLVVLAALSILIINWKQLNEVMIAVLVAILTGALGSMTSMGSLVIGFYFGRTNHTKSGGVGGDRISDGR